MSPKTRRVSRKCSIVIPLWLVACEKRNQDPKPLPAKPCTLSPSSLGNRCGVPPPQDPTGFGGVQEYEVLLLVGAGIGVTPFASVLADLVNRMDSQRCRLCGEVGHNLTPRRNPEVVSHKHVPKFRTHRFFLYACPGTTDGSPALLCNMVVGWLFVPLACKFYIASIVSR